MPSGPPTNYDIDLLRSVSPPLEIAPSNTIAAVVIQKRTKMIGWCIRHHTPPCKPLFVTYCMEKYNKLSHEDTNIADYTFDASRDPMWEAHLSDYDIYFVIYFLRNYQLLSFNIGSLMFYYRFVQGGSLRIRVVRSNATIIATPRWDWAHRYIGA